MSDSEQKKAAKPQLKLRSGTGYTQNRELSWLKFNKRVLEEAEDNTVPLCERLKFVEIFTSNLDEFFMVRVGSLLSLEAMNPTKRDNKSHMTAGEQLHAIFDKVRELYGQRDRIFDHLRRRLLEKGIGHVDIRDLSKKQYGYLEEYFQECILPLLSPQIIDKHHPFPHLDNKKLYVSAILKGKKKMIFGIIPLPDSLNRVVYLSKERTEFVLLEDIIEEFVDRIFTGYPVLDKAVFAITRSAEINLEEEEVEAGDYLEAMKKAIRKRRHLTPVRLEIRSQGKSIISAYLIDRYKISSEQVFATTAPLTLDYVYSLEGNMTELLKQELYYSPYTPVGVEEKFHLAEGETLGDLVKQRDILLRYPYDDFGILLQLIKEAVYSPNVLSIRITIYRVGKGHVKLMNYLMVAAEMGKDVTVLLELKARFDEENNISWVNGLREAGCKILYGFDRYKVHAKLCQITYREPQEQGVKYITHIGTGNFNAKTAKLYTDFALLTTDDAIGRDGSMFFRNMGIGNLMGEYQKLLVAPANLKSTLLDLIQGEIEKAKKGQEAYILLKMNSLTDRQMIDALYTAGQAGVRIDMIVRGITCLVPERPGLTDNIHIRSIVGRFLEHPRVFCFGKGEDMKMYIASADWMTRNTENRVEVAAPVQDASIRQEILQMLELQLSDNTKARNIDADGEYYKPPVGPGDELINAQEYYIEHR